MPTARHRPLAALAVGLLATFGLTGLPAMSATAADSDSPATLTLSPSSGSNIATDAITLNTTLTCPGGSFPLGVWVSDTDFTAPLTPGTGNNYIKQLQTGGTDTGIEARSGVTWSSANTSGNGAAFYDASATVFPATSTITWYDTKPSVAATTSLLDAVGAGTYRLAVACLTAPSGVFSDSNGDVTGHLVMAWTTFTITADGSWSTPTSAPVAAATTTTIEAAHADATATTGTLTAHVGSTSSTVGEGSVQFYEGSGDTTPVGSAESVSAGIATLPLTGLSVGTHTYHAKYTGTANFTDSASTSDATITVTSAPTMADTTTAIEAAHADATATTGTLTAHVGSASSTVGEGTVQFYEGSGDTTPVGAAQSVSAGTATLPLTGLSVGTHTYHAKYTGTANFTDSASTSDATITVTAPVDDSTTLAVAAAPDVAAGGAISIALTATVSQGSATATDAEGTVQFARDGFDIGTPVPVASGVATYTDVDASLAFDTAYAYTATFTPGSGSDLDAATTDPATTVEVTAPVVLTAGSTATPGTLYKVTTPDGTFADNETVTGVVHSAPVAVGAVTSTAAGGATFTFAMPSGLDAGSHTLALTGAAGGTFTVAFSIASGTNDPAIFATDWANQASANSTTIIVLFGALLLLVAAGVVAWNVFWRRRHGLKPTRG